MTLASLNAFHVIEVVGGVRAFGLLPVLVAFPVVVLCGGHRYAWERDAQPR